METMCMYFYQSSKVKFILEQFDVQSSGQYCIVMLVAFTLGFLTESLNIIIDSYDKSTTQQLISEASVQTNRRIVSLAMFSARLLCAYLCMLTVMTYNLGLLVAVVLGLTTAFVFFGFKPTKVTLLHDSFVNNGNCCC